MRVSQVVRSLARMPGFTVVAAMALLLGLTGIYAVISYSVSQRTREIGIRVALGAQARSVRRTFVAHGLVLGSVGVAIGIAVAAGMMRLTSSSERSSRCALSLHTLTRSTTTCAGPDPNGVPADNTKEPRPTDRRDIAASRTPRMVSCRP